MSSISALLCSDATLVLMVLQVWLLSFLLNFLVIIPVPCIGQRQVLHLMTHPGRLSCHTPCLPGPGTPKKQLQPGWLFPPAMLAWGCRYLPAPQPAGFGPLHSNQCLFVLAVSLQDAHSKLQLHHLLHQLPALKTLAVAALCCSCQCY